ncbi:efflux RND transporter periplasmic adaptor subunit [Chitinophaga sp.]|uniref:efflux RND transporter periplasmic adaptor subunit n=1 Tax=Chitinophaga sp. TaxID=1869181 RepID=UPI0031CE786E
MIQLIKRFAAALLLCLTLAGCGGGQKEEPAAIAPPCINQALKKRISLEPATLQPWHANLLLNGKVGYDEDKVYRFVPLLSGVVQQVHFTLGDYVKKGQLLMEIKSAELSNLHAELQDGQARLQLAERKLSATEELHKTGVAADKDLLEANTEVATARTQIRRIRETLALYGGSLEKGALLVHAAMDGYVVEKNVIAGGQVEAGQQPLFVLSGLQQVWVKASIYAGQLENVNAGQQVDITTTAYPDKIFTGRISRLSNVFDPEERVLKAIIKIDNKGLLLKPDMMVNVNVHQPAQDSAVAVPARAVLFDNNRYYALVYHGDCDVQAVPLEPVFQTKEHYFVKSGIHAGDTIITRNQLLIYNRLKESQTVK